MRTSNHFTLYRKLKKEEGNTLFSLPNKLKMRREYTELTFENKKKKLKNVYVDTHSVH
jgi:hypothetical protein